MGVGIGGKSLIKRSWILSLSFSVFLGCMIYLYVFFVLSYLGHLSHFPSCFGAGVTNLNDPPSSFLLPPRCCGLGAGSIPLKAIVNKKQCETRGLFMSLVIRYLIGDVQDSQCVCIPPNVTFFHHVTQISYSTELTFKGTT